MLDFRRVSTEDVHEPERWRVWELALRDNLGMSVRKGAEPFASASFEAACLRGMGFYRLSSARPYRVERTAIAAAKDASACVKLALVLNGLSSFERGNETKILQRGDWAVFDNSTPYVSQSDGDVQMLILTIPKTHFQNRSYSVDDHAISKLRGDCGLGRMAYQFICNAFEELPFWGTHYQSSVADTVVELVGLAMLEHRPKTLAPTAQAVLRERITAYVAENLPDPELSVYTIARALRCSTRYIHLAFQERSQSVTRYIWQSRLARCHSILAKSQNADRTITDIAFGTGFNSVGHFSTLFKSEYGVTPRRFRKESLGVDHVP
jgi:AraC-like DNA-binding protein